MQADEIVIKSTLLSFASVSICLSVVCVRASTFWLCVYVQQPETNLISITVQTIKFMLIKNQHMNDSEKFFALYLHPFLQIAALSLLHE
jgi:uncharacterized protein (DUF983 family)